MFLMNVMRFEENFNLKIYLNILIIFLIEYLIEKNQKNQKNKLILKLYKKSLCMENIKS